MQSVLGVRETSLWRLLQREVPAGFSPVGVVTLPRARVAALFLHVPSGSYWAFWCGQRAMLPREQCLHHLSALI